MSITTAASPRLKEMTDGYIVAEHGFAEPKTDWRQRGVIPRFGIHRRTRDAEAKESGG